MSINWKQTASALKSWREKRHMTQDKLAALIGVRWNTIARIEIGDRRPSIDLLEKIAHALGCRVRDLLKEEGNPMVTMQAKREPSFLGAPNFLRACVRDAGERTSGANYATVGYSFSGMLSLGDLSETAFSELEELCQEKNQSVFTESLLKFIEDEFPACIKLVPPRRRQQFLKGVIRGMAEGRCDFQPAIAEQIVDQNRG